MGKKSGRHGGEKEKEAEEGAKAFTLKVAMHCHCNGCTDKIHAAVKDLTRHPGIEALDQSALDSKGELKLLATADPEALRRRLHKATHKNVEVAFPRAAADKADDRDAADALRALLRDTLQPQYGWNAQQQQQPPGYGYAAAQAYPWGVQAADPYAYPPAAGAYGAYQGYGGAAWY